MAERHTIRLALLRSADVGEFRAFLADLERAYIAFYNLPTERIVFFRRTPFFTDVWDSGYGAPNRGLHARGVDIVPDERLRLERISIQSPGWGDFSGLSGPLETLRNYLNDRHERKKDKEWRTGQQRERGELENELLEAQVASEKVNAVKQYADMLEQLGVPPEERRRIIFERLGNPLEKLGRHQDTRLLGGPEKPRDRG